MRSLLQDQCCLGVKYVSFDEALIDHAGENGFNVFGLQCRIAPRHPCGREKDVEMHRRRSRRDWRGTVSKAQAFGSCQIKKKGSAVLPSQSPLILFQVDSPFARQIAPKANLQLFA